MGQRKDERAAELYAAYQSGLSLSEVGKRFGVSRTAVYGMFASRNFPLRSKMRLETVEFNGAQYTVNILGYYRRTDGERTLMHRDMWEFFNGPIPDGYDIHHKDENKQHNELSNFECLPTPDHTRLHNPMREVEEKFCLYCGERLTRKLRTNGWETPSAFSKRNYCTPQHSRMHAKGKPKGWGPNVHSW